MPTPASVLDKLPGAETLRKQLTKIMTAKTTSHGNFYYRGGQLFAMRRAAAQAAAVPRRAAGARPARQGPRPRRSQRDRREGDHRHRLVRPLARRQARGRVAVQGRHRDRRRPRLRRRHGQGGVRGRAARQRRHGRRRPGLGAGRQGLLLHPLPARPGAAGRGHRFLPAGLLPRAGHADGKGPLRDWARTCRASPRSSWRRTTPPAGCWPRCRTATAASSPSSCAIRRANGGNSARSRTSWCRPPSAATTTCSSISLAGRAARQAAAAVREGPRRGQGEGRRAGGQGHHRRRLPRLFEPADGAADGEPAVRHLPTRRPDGGALLRLRRQAARRAEAAAHLHRRRPGAG